MRGHDLFFSRETHCLISVTKVRDMRTYQNVHTCNVLLIFPTNKTGNNALDINAIDNLKLRKHKLIQQTALLLLPN
jgi:hypothetical protein